MINILKDKDKLASMDKIDVINFIKSQLVEWNGVSDRTIISRDTFEKPTWAYIQAYEAGYQKAIKQMEELINI